MAEMRSSEFSQFETTLASAGLLAALRFLSFRTPHRFTGIYRFDGDMLRNEMLVDRFDSQVSRGSDAPLTETYCSIVGSRRHSLEFADIRSRADTRPRPPVVAYCGALITDREGNEYGTLCHFDVQPCEQRTSDLPLLEAAVGLIFDALAARRSVYHPPPLV